MITADGRYWNETETTIAFLSEGAWFFRSGYVGEDEQPIGERLIAADHPGIEEHLHHLGFWPLTGADLHKLNGVIDGLSVEKFYLNPAKIQRIEPTVEGALFRVKLPLRSVTLSPEGATDLMHALSVPKDRSAR